MERGGVTGEDELGAFLVPSSCPLAHHCGGPQLRVCGSPALKIYVKTISKAGVELFLQNKRDDIHTEKHTFISLSNSILIDRGMRSAISLYSL